MNVLPGDKVDRLYEHWTRDPAVRDQFSSVRVTSPRQAAITPLPNGIDAGLADILAAMGISALYAHQAEAFARIKAGQNVVISTGTASGKTLCYNLPVLDTILSTRSASALYIYPTKALAQDQQQKLLAFAEAAAPSTRNRLPASAIYDGDTPTHSRKQIREKAGIILTNPDMLHAGILPFHMLWERFLEQLKFVVIDEVHYYRGVFGSHIANVLRRLNRLCSFYGATPQFILTSATIANPIQLAESITGQPFVLIDNDGSPKGRKIFAFYNPPIIDEKLGIRKSIYPEAVELGKDLLRNDVQTIMFTKSRRSVELLYRELQSRFGRNVGNISSYRSGYLASDRRRIENDIRENKSKLTVSTNALELGIDIGGLDAILMLGYPGTMAATRQQSGRAGRKQDTSLAVLMASPNPQDQYLVNHPEYFYEKPVENALINPDNLPILLQHLQCSIFELPLKQGENFGSLTFDMIKPILDYLVQIKAVHLSGNQYRWVSSTQPSTTVSLRTAENTRISLSVIEEDHHYLLGDIDYSSALWMVHPQAIYLHEGASYRVEELDLEGSRALLKPLDPDYYTEPMRQTKIELIKLLQEVRMPHGSRYYGEVKVKTRVTGYKMINWETRTVLGMAPLDMPETELITTAVWFAIDREMVDKLKAAGMWNSDDNDYGSIWPNQRKKALERDRYTCQHCGISGDRTPLHVHHIVPYRFNESNSMVNALENLITLCPVCHEQAEMKLRIRGGLTGLAYALQNMSTLTLMCDPGDLGSFVEPNSDLADDNAVVLFYDLAAGGIGLSDTFFSKYQEVFDQTEELISQCACLDGCPSCVGPAGENGIGGKQISLAILKALMGRDE